MTRAKPDFSASFSWADGEFPAETVRCLMLALKKSPLSDAQKNDLVEYACDMGQLLMGDDTPLAEARAQIDRVASDARRLLQSLALLCEPARAAFRVQNDQATYGRPAAKADLSASWDCISELEKTAAAAALIIKPSKISKPTLLRARAFVCMLAEHVRSMTGAAPPKDPPSWFAEFCVVAGDHFGMDVGPRIIDSGVKASCPRAPTLTTKKTSTT